MPVQDNTGPSVFALRANYVPECVALVAAATTSTQLPSKACTHLYNSWKLNTAARVMRRGGSPAKVTQLAPPAGPSPLITRALCGWDSTRHDSIGVPRARS